MGERNALACMRTKNIQTEIDLSDVWGLPAHAVKNQKKILKFGDILVSTANSWSLVGKCCWVPELPWPSTLGGFISALRPINEKIDARYLYRWFSYENTQRKVKRCARQTTNIANLNMDQCLEIRLPAPPLHEQRRIAAILDQADDLRRKRREALEKLSRLHSVSFEDAFGDPVQNKKGWHRITFASLLGEITSGWSPVCLDRPASNREWGVLKLSAVTQCEFNESEQKALPEGVLPKPSIEIKPGDILFTRKNTSDLVGACVVVKATRSKLMFPDLIYRIQVGKNAPINPEFLHALLTYPTKRRQIQRLASGSAGSMPNISREKLRQVQIESPPLDLQQAFAARVAEIDKIKAQHRAHLARLDALFASLQHRAFRGEL